MAREVNLADRLIDSLRLLSNASLILYGSILVLSVYLIQRSAEVGLPYVHLLTGELAVPRSVEDPPAPQARIWDLGFYRITLSVAWPLVLGVMCVALRRLLEKRDAVFAALAEELSGRDAATLEALDPFLFRRISATAWQTWLFRVLHSLPALAIVAVAASAIFSASLIHWPGQTFGPLRYLLMSIGFLQLVAVLVAASWIRGFPATAGRFQAVGGTRIADRRTGA